MDWGMCKPHARYLLLRPELVYKSQIPVRFLVSINLFNPTDDVLVLLPFYGMITDPSLLVPSFNFLFAGIQPMHSFHLVDFRVHRPGKHRAILIHCCLFGDVAEGAVEFLYAIFSFPS